MVVPCAAKGTILIAGLRTLVGACVGVELLAEVIAGVGTDVGAGGWGGF